MPDLDAIRTGLLYSDGHPAWGHVESLLAEVDRLARDNQRLASDFMAVAADNGRALPVIEAARALLTEEEDGYFVYTKPNREAWGALRTALAEYDR